jgi:hypothetical protein
MIKEAKVSWHLPLQLHSWRMERCPFARVRVIDSQKLSL